MTVVKICGITTFEDAMHVAVSGADVLGFNLWPKSKRYIAPQDAATLCDRLRAELAGDCPLLVGVFVNAGVSEISREMEIVGLDFAQLSGDESDMILRELHGVAFKSIRPATVAQAEDDLNYFRPVFPLDERAPSLLLDASVLGEYGGTGQQALDEIAQQVRATVPRLMLAGGLTPDNVCERIASVNPWGVDVASGVENGVAGRKDAVKVTDFIAAAKGL